MKRLVLLGLAGVLGAMAVAGAGSQHTVSVTLNYDFSVDNGCSSTVTTGCVKQFNIYDITGGGTPVKLFSIAAPSGANSAVTGITGTSGLVTLKSGVHTFAATAQMADGTESSPNGSTATAGVAPGSPANFSVVVRRTQRLLCDLCVSLSLSSSQKQKSPGNLPRPTTLLYAA
ncbi:MAG TPA: hypothetical protein VNY24_19460 [Candidatus Acidoferrales bacterium]|jgi:hypothetical protein|nr:hypothetical protein [Candidatus Acidoferrales bacterium]